MGVPVVQDILDGGVACVDAGRRRPKEAVETPEAHEVRIGVDVALAFPAAFYVGVGDKGITVKDLYLLRRIVTQDAVRDGR